MLEKKDIPYFDVIEGKKVEDREKCIMINITIHKLRRILHGYDQGI